MSNDYKKGRELFALLLKLKASVRFHKQAHESTSASIMGLLVINDYCKEHNNGVMISNFAKILRISKPAATIKITEYDKKGLIIKTPDDLDKRKVYITLSPKGLDLINERKDEAIRNFDDIANGFSDEELRIFTEMVERLIRMFDETRENSEPNERKFSK